MKKHPLDEVFGIDYEEEMQLEIEDDYALVQTEQLPVQADQKDADDVEIERKIDEVFSQAMDAFARQNDFVDIVEPKFAARNAEVAAGYLSIALNAATSRAKIKSDRKRASTFIPQAGKTTNNILVASREEIMKMIDMDDHKTEV
jgi:hypothetical protein